MMNAHFAAAVPNLRVMEVDMDRLSWDDELFGGSPRIEKGELVIPDTPGWGIAPDERALKKHPPR
jgi:galactonate dehydratase